MDDRTQKDLDHAINPKVGDYWHEMFTPVAVVVEVSERVVVTCEKTMATDDDHWTWDISSVHAYTREQFANRFRYGRIGNKKFKAGDDMDIIKNRFWCDVSPESHKWIAEAA